MNRSSRTTGPPTATATCDRGCVFHGSIRQLLAPVPLRPSGGHVSSVARRSTGSAAAATVHPMGGPPKLPATYEDLLAVPKHMVAEIIHGALVTTPRPASRHALASSILGS